MSFLFSFHPDQAGWKEINRKLHAYNLVLLLTRLLSPSTRLFTTMPKSGSGSAGATRACTSSWPSGQTSSSSRRSTPSPSPRFESSRQLSCSNFQLSRILLTDRARRLRQPGVVRLPGVAPRGAAHAGLPEHEHVDVEPPGHEGEREEGQVKSEYLVFMFKITPPAKHSCEQIYV